jgi:flagellar motor switch protein FliM
LIGKKPNDIESVESTKNTESAESMDKPRVGTRLFMTPKEGAFLAGISYSALVERLRGPNPPPHKKRGRRYLLPIREFTDWATQDVIE